MFVQSNVEDVAVTMAERIEGADTKGLVPYAGAGAGKETNVTADVDAGLRQDRWRAIGGSWATGPGWMSCAIFPFARTETEATYERMDKPIFRKLWIREPA